MVGPLLPDTSIWQWEYGLELHGHLHQEAGHLHQEAGVHKKLGSALNTYLRNWKSKNVVVWNKLSLVIILLEKHVVHSHFIQRTFFVLWNSVVFINYGRFGLVKHVKICVLSWYF